MLNSSAKARLYYLLRRALSQQTRDALKKRQKAARRRMGRVFSLVHGTYTAKDLVKDLLERIPADTEILMIHSSYDRLLPMYTGRPQDIVDALIAACGANTTLVMPAFFLGGRTRNKREYYEAHAFDVKRTMSEMGLLTEVFRRAPHVLRSLHPTHSICARGPLADQLTATHHLAFTRTGKGTPFELMAQRRCAIAGLGVEYFRVLTQTHIAEDMLGDEFPIDFSKETFPVTMIDRDGRTVPYELTVGTTSKTLDNTVLRSLMRADALKEWTFRGTPLFVTFAGEVTNALIDGAKRGITVYGSYPPRGRVAS
jgi:aminoglycoside N3'-acetyltransferase